MSTHTSQVNWRAAVLVIDQNRSEGDRRAVALTRDGWAADSVTSAHAARQHLTTHHPDGVVIANVISETLLLVRELRAGDLRSVDPATSVVMMPAGEQTALSAYQAGADLTLPPRVPAALLDAALASTLRQRVTQHQQVTQIGDICVDRSMREVTVAGVQIALTRREFDLMAALGSTDARVFTKVQLANAVWNDPVMATNSRVIDQNVSRINRKAQAAGVRRPVAGTASRGYTLHRQDITR